MTIHELIKVAEKKITNSTSPTLDGEVLLSFVLGKPKEFLLANPFRKVDAKSEKLYFRLVNRRLLGWPVAYLTKHKEFFKLDFYIDKHVLVPRPETEGLVELIIDTLKTEKKKLKILDVGTGSGCIIISLAKNLGRKHEYFASDLSPQAVKIAKKNAKELKAKVAIGDGYLLDPWKDEAFDVIVANLPYLAKLVDHSTKFEPIGALLAAKKGLKLYEELFKQIRNGNKPKYIFLEIGRDQGLPIKKLASKLLPASSAGGPEYKVKTFRDLFGRTRYVQLVQKSSRV